MNLTHGQSADNSSNLYLMALDAYAARIAALRAEFLACPMPSDEIYIEGNGPLDSVPDKLHGIKVNLLSHENFFQHYERCDGFLRQIRIFPVEISGGQARIRLTPFRGTMGKKRKLELELSDWTIVVFKFNCETNSWEIEDVETDGI